MALRRRLVTFPALLSGWALVWATAPLAVLVAAIVGAFRRRRFIGLRMLAFVMVYTSLELVGLGLATFVSLTSRPGSPRWKVRHYALQEWWANKLFGAARRLLRLELSVEGDDAVGPGPILLLLRHASLADALLPAALVTRRHGINLRYVLKKELLVDPCLDLVGHRLPNHFVDRAQPTDEDREAIADLARDLGAHEGVIIYPEGTRFSAKKRERILRRFEEKGSPHLEEAKALTHTLPPRLGGVSTLLDAAPSVDVVICAHVGFEGFANFADLFSGDMVGRALRIKFWRVSAGDIPREPEARTAWLYDEWRKIDDFVHCHPVVEPVPDAAVDGLHEPV